MAARRCGRQNLFFGTLQASLERFKALRPHQLRRHLCRRKAGHAKQATQSKIRGRRRRPPAARPLSARRGGLRSEMRLLALHRVESLGCTRGTHTRRSTRAQQNEPSRAKIEGLVPSPRRAQVQPEFPKRDGFASDRLVSYRQRIEL